MVARALTTSNQRIDAETETLLVAHSLRGEGFDASEDGTGRGTPLVPVAFAMRGREDGALPEIHAGGQTVGSLRAASGGSSRDYIAFDCKSSGQNGFAIGDIAGTQRAMGHANSHTNGGGHQAVAYGSAARRLTPRECERLQGFPDDYTAILRSGKPAADGPRYKALGNSMAVNVMRWIGSRIDEVSTLKIAA